MKNSTHFEVQIKRTLLLGILIFWIPLHLMAQLDDRLSIDSLFQKIKTNNRIDLEKDLNYSKKGIQLAVKEKEDSALAEFYRIHGQAYYFKGMYDSAVENYYKSLNISEKSNYKIASAHTYNELAKLFKKTSDFENALEFYDKALQTFTEVENSEGIAIILNESGSLFEIKGDLEEAQKRYQQSLDIQIQRNDKVGIAYSKQFLSSILTQKKDYPKAEKLLKEALLIRKEIKDTFAMALNYNALGEFYLAQNKFEPSLENFLLSNELAAKINFADLLQYNLQMVADIHERTGNYALAYNTLKEQKKLQDSIFNFNKIKQIQELTHKYEAVEKDNLILNQKNTLKRRSLIILIISGISLFILSFLWFYYRNRRNKQELKYQQALMQEQNNSAIKIIETEDKERQRMSLLLHDNVGQLLTAAILNLNALEPGISNEKSEKIVSKIDNILGECRNEVRQISHAIMPVKLMDKSLVEALEEMLDQFRDNGIQIELIASEPFIDPDNLIKASIFRMIQECINNTVKYAEASEIKVVLESESANLNLTYTDNGKGFDTLAIASGMGLENMKNIINILQGDMHIISNESGTTVTAQIPLKQNVQNN